MLRRYKFLIDWEKKDIFVKSNYYFGAYVKDEQSFEAWLNQQAKRMVILERALMLACEEIVGSEDQYKFFDKFTNFYEKAEVIVDEQEKAYEEHLVDSLDK